MWIIELLVVLIFIFLGARLGSIGIGFAGGLGVLVLALVFGLTPGDIPIDVILIIMSVIAAIAAMQVAGGLDYLVFLAERILRSNPKYITFLAPLLTYSSNTILATSKFEVIFRELVHDLQREHQPRRGAPDVLRVDRDVDRR